MAMEMTEWTAVDHGLYGPGFEWVEKDERGQVIKAGAMYGYGSADPWGKDFGEALSHFLRWWEEEAVEKGREEEAATSDLPMALFPEWYGIDE
mgnify:CR=1 FL=1